MNPGWNLIYTTTNTIEAEMIIALLQQHAIKSVALNKQDSSYQNFGNIGIYCPAIDTITALHIIEQYQQPSHEK
jgi:type III secretory pathway lipoprotein EscJ